MNNGDDWQRAWDPVIAAVGQPVQFLESREGVLPDPVEAGAIRKYLEPLEFDCALHYDREAARARGYADVITPYTAMVSFALLPTWLPGMSLFPTAERNAQPAESPVKPKYPDFFPPFTGYFATDMAFDFIRPAVPGDVLRMEIPILLSCTPKETSVGRGAFLKTEGRIVNQTGELLAIMRSGSFVYTPHQEPAA